MKSLLKSICAAGLLSAAGMAAAAPVPIDLSSWQSDGQGTWNVQGAGNDSVFQSINGRPTVFFKDGDNAQNTAVSGTITVETTGDDDFIGFVLGYQDDELLSATSEYILIDWKQQNQGPAAVGMAASLVQGATSDNDFWTHTGNISEIARANTLGSTGWNDNQSYDFDIVFTANLIQVSVDNVLQLSFTAAQAGLTSFSDGAAGFYNYSQGSVRYAGVAEEVVVNASTPLTLSLILLGGLAIVGFRKR